MNSGSTLVLDISDTYIKYGMGGSKTPNIAPLFDTIETHISSIFELYGNTIDRVIICESITYIKNKKDITNSIKKLNILTQIFSYDKLLLALYGFGRDTGMVIYADGIWKISTFYDSYRLENTVKYFKYKDIEHLANTIQKNIKKVDIDLRKKIAKNIIIVGNYSISKLGKKLIEYLDKKYYYVIYTPIDSMDMSWIGGSVVTQLDFFKNN